MLVMQALKDVWNEFKIKKVYNTDREDAIKNFYVPLLRNTKNYWRESGYFSSGSFAIAAIGFLEFMENGGKMQLIVGKMSLQDDIDQIEKLESLDIEEINKRFWKGYEELDWFEKEHVKMLGYMMKKNQLEIMVAEKVNPPYGKDHSKIGIFIGESDVVTMVGSNNESINGWEFDRDTFLVQNSWGENKDIVENLKSNFLGQWQSSGGTVHGYKYIPIMDKIKEGLKAEGEKFDKKKLKGAYRERGWTNGSAEEVSEQRNLREHQKDAIEYWINDSWNARRKEKFIGVFEMATGSGKTFTAVRALKDNVPAGIFHVILAPSNDIVEQWVREIKDVIGEDEAITTLCSTAEHAQDSNKWKEWVRLSLAGVKKTRWFVSTYKSFFLSMDELAKNLNAYEGGFSITVDEVHGIGSSEYRKILKKMKKSNYRLGLSATPQRKEIGGGSKEIQEFFSDYNFEYSLEKAMEDKQLCTYDYKIHQAELNYNESVNYEKISNEISELIARYLNEFGVDGVFQIINRLWNLDRDKEAKALQNKFFDRSDIIKTAKDKLKVLKGILLEIEKREEFKCFVYCEDTPHMEEVLGVMNQLGIEGVEKITGKHNPKERRVKLERFKSTSGKRYLVAMRVLDQGVDIPACDVAILLSNTAERRQFIQRRGRVLRPLHADVCEFNRERPAQSTSKCDDLNCKLHATVYDIIVLPEQPVQNHEKGIVKVELERMEEFIKAAKNNEEAENVRRRIEIMFD